MCGPWALSSTRSCMAIPSTRARITRKCSIRYSRLRLRWGMRASGRPSKICWLVCSRRNRTRGPSLQWYARLSKRYLMRSQARTHRQNCRSTKSQASKAWQEPTKSQSWTMTPKSASVLRSKSPTFPSRTSEPSAKRHTKSELSKNQLWTKIVPSTNKPTSSLRRWTAKERWWRSTSKSQPRLAAPRRTRSNQPSERVQKQRWLRS